MSAPSLEQALERCERALLRIERSAASPRHEPSGHSELRAQVASVVAELDEIIRTAGSRG